VVASTAGPAPHPLLVAVQEQVGSWETASSQNPLRLKVGGIPYWAEVESVQSEGRLGFYFVHGIPEATLLAEVRRSAQQAALLGGGLLLSMLGTGILLGEALSRPLRRLTQIAEQFIQSGFQPFIHSGFQPWPPLDPGPIQEVQTLAKAWQQAAAAQQALLDRLWQQQQEYRAVVEQQTELICRFRPNGHITYVNSALLRFFDHRVEEVVGRALWDLLLEEKREVVLQAFAALTPESPFYSSEREYPGKDGQSRWISWVDQGIFDSRGRLVEILSVGREITEQKRAEQQLQALNRELEAQVELRTAKLQQALHFEGVLRAISSRMVVSLNEGEILEEVVKTLAEALGLTCCQVLLLLEDGSTWIPGYCYSPLLSSDVQLKMATGRIPCMGQTTPVTRSSCACRSPILPRSRNGKSTAVVAQGRGTLGAAAGLHPLGQREAAGSFAVGAAAGARVFRRRDSTGLSGGQPMCPGHPPSPFVPSSPSAGEGIGAAESAEG
jgi:PAS domain S-box-containing protein